MLGIVSRQSRLGINRLQAHQTHQASGPLSVDAQNLGHLPAAVERRLQVLFVDPTHPLHILRRLARRLVIPTRSVQSQKFALPANAYAGTARLDALPLELNRVGQLFFSTTPVPSAIDRFARTGQRSAHPAPGFPGDDHPKTARPIPPTTASSSSRSASDERQIGMPTRS